MMESRGSKTGILATCLLDDDLGPSAYPLLASLSSSVNRGDKYRHCPGLAAETFSVKMLRERQA